MKNKAIEIDQYRLIVLRAYNRLDFKKFLSFKKNSTGKLKETFDVFFNIGVYDHCYILRDNGALDQLDYSTSEIGFNTIALNLLSEGNVIPEDYYAALFNLTFLDQFAFKDLMEDLGIRREE